MSVRVMSLVWDSTVPAPERFTLLALADRADEDGKCWPSIKTLAQKCCTGESTVRRHLTALTKQRVVEVAHRWNASSMYVINLGRLRELAYVPPEPKRTRTPSQSDTPLQIDTPSQIDRGSRSDTPSQSERTPPPNLSGPPSQIEHLSISDPSGDSSGGPRKRGTRIPDDFQVTDAMKTWARQHTPLVGQAETDLFVDYWQSESGAKASKTDWRKAWQVWMRREQKTAERRPAHLRAVPAPVKAALGSFEEYRTAAAGKEAARLLGIGFNPRPQPPSDKTSYDEWARMTAVEWIDAHETELRAALTERKTG